MSGLPSDAIVITGLGMYTSLGGTSTACAAARAGLSAGCEITSFLARDEQRNEVPGTGHPVAFVDGFLGKARLFCLAWGAFDELLRSTALTAQGAAGIGLALGLADPSLRQLATDAQGKPTTPPVRSFGPGLFNRLSRRTGLELSDAHRLSFDEARTGVVRATMEAALKLRRGEWQRAIVGGVDSLVDPAALDRLAADGVLKTPKKPDGVHPGEAGAFMMLERLDMARRRRVEPLAVVAGGCVTSEPTTTAEPRPPSNGIALAQAAARALGADGRSAWLISDHNGEHRRGSELGSALARLAQTAPSLASARRWLPAESFGDTGAACGVIAACLATRAFARGYAPAPSAVIVTSEDGRAGALRIDGI